MKRPIITDLRILKQKSIDIIYPNEAEILICDLEDTLKEHKTGIGLAGVQIGILKNVAIIRMEETKINLINAYIIEKENPIRVDEEGCLSLPNIKVTTKRYNNIKIINNGKEEEYSGIIAVVIQHEIDHCFGLTILNRKWKHR